MLFFLIIHLFNLFTPIKSSSVSVIDSMIAVEQSNDEEKHPKAFRERYCKKVFDVNPTYHTITVESGGSDNDKIINNEEYKLPGFYFNILFYF